MRHPYEILSLCVLDLNRDERVWLSGYDTGHVDSARGVTSTVGRDNPIWRDGYIFAQSEGS